MTTTPRTPRPPRRPRTWPEASGARERLFLLATAGDAALRRPHRYDQHADTWTDLQTGQVRRVTLEASVSLARLADRGCSRSLAMHLIDMPTDDNPQAHTTGDAQR